MSLDTRRSVVAYLAAALGSTLATVFAMRLWQADLRIPFVWTGDAVSSAAHVKATVQWGWYESQPDLGAPFGQSYHDYPFGDNLPLVFAKVAGWFTGSWPLVFNAYFLLGFPLAAVSGLWFARRCGVSRSVGVALGILFAVAPYHWIRGESHFYLAGYWLVPIGVWVALTALQGRSIWDNRRAADVRGLRRIPGLLTGRNLAIVVGLTLLATSAAYYAVFTAVVLGFAGVLSLVRTRAWGRFVGAAVAGVLLVAVVLLNVLPDLLYQRVNGSNPDAFARPMGDPEVYALKITALLLPAPGHRIPFLSQLRDDYDAFYPLKSEVPALGFVAAVGLLCALGLVVYAALRAVLGGTGDRSTEVGTRRSTIGALGLLSVLMVLISTVGGIGTILSSVSESLRGWNRMSILIAIACLALVGLLVDGLVERLTRRRARHRVVLARLVAAGLVTVVGVFDQSTSWATPSYESVQAEWNSDLAFVRGVEATAGPDAMLLQVPFIAFPESAPVYESTDSDVVKLSLLSDTLRWSGGGIKGRPRSDWVRDATALPTDEMIAVGAEMGFTGIVVDTGATPDAGTALTADLADRLGPAQVESSDRRWIYFPLAGPLAEVQAATTPAERAAFAELMRTDPPAAIRQVWRP